jgi:proteasome lid subunit RPN8/RPN11
VLTSGIRDELVRLAREGAGREVCGIVAGTGEHAIRVFPIANVHAEPERRYVMDPRGQLEAYRAIEDAGLEVVAYYHSHPDFARPELSATDLAQATEGEYALYALVHGGRVRAFAVDRGAAREVPLEIAS